MKNGETENDYLDSHTRELVDRFKDAEAKNKRRKAFIWSGFSIVGYVWDVIRNLIVISVVLLIFGAVYGSFETIVVSILILIYSTLVINGAVLVQQSATNILQTFHQGVETRKRLGQPVTEEEEEEFEQAGFLLEKVRIKFYINMTANFLIFLIILFNLLGAL